MPFVVMLVLEGATFVFWKIRDCRKVFRVTGNQSRSPKEAGQLRHAMGLSELCSFGDILLRASALYEESNVSSTTDILS